MKEEDTYKGVERYHPVKWLSERTFTIVLYFNERGRGRALGERVKWANPEMNYPACTSSGKRALNNSYLSPEPCLPLPTGSSRPLTASPQPRKPRPPCCKQEDFKDPMRSLSPPPFSWPSPREESGIQKVGFEGPRLVKVCCSELAQGMGRLSESMGLQSFHRRICIISNTNHDSKK